MRLEYQHRVREIVTAGHDKRVYGEYVKPGLILNVISCFLHMPDSKINDVATLYVERPGLHLEIRSRARDAAKQGMSSLNPFYVGEGQRVVGESLSSGLNDELCLTVIGELIPLRRWRKGKV